MGLAWWHFRSLHGRQVCNNLRALNKYQVCREMLVPQPSNLEELISNPDEDRPWLIQGLRLTPKKWWCATKMDVHGCTFPATAWTIICKKICIIIIHPQLTLYCISLKWPSQKKKSSPTGFANGKSTIQILHVPVIFPKSHAISSETVWLWLLNCQSLVKQTTSWGLASWDPEHARFIVLGRKRSSWRSPGFFQHNWGFCWKFARNQRSTPRPTKYNPKMVKYRKSTELMG